MGVYSLEETRLYFFCGILWSDFVWDPFVEPLLEFILEHPYHWNHFPLESLCWDVQFGWQTISSLVVAWMENHFSKGQLLCYGVRIARSF